MTDIADDKPIIDAKQKTEATPETAPEKEPKEKRKLTHLRMILHYALQYPKQILFAAIALFVAAFATLAIPASLKLIGDYAFGASATGNMMPSGMETETGAALIEQVQMNMAQDIGLYFKMLLVIVVILAIATAVRFYFVSWLGERVVADIREAVQKNLLRLSPKFFEENRPAEIASRLTADTAIIEQIVGTTASVALRNTLIGIIGLIYLFYLAPALTAGLLLGIPVVIIPIVVIGRRLEKVSKASQDRVADIGTITSEALGAIKIVQAFGQETHEYNRFAKAVENTFATAKRRIALRSLLTSIVIGLIFGGIISLMWEGAINVQEGKISPGTIASFVAVGVFVAGSFGALTEVYGDLVRGAGASARLAELLAEEPDIAPPAKAIALPEPRGQLTFDSVNFRYPTRQEVLALNNFNLRITPGETVAVVGPSGAGKSTLFQMAQRFYDPESGAIRIDGVPLTQADPAAVRTRMAYVPQETVLFASSARDNLRYGNWLATDEEIWEAARQANAESFLKELPQGLDTYLGEGGARLSGGQRQRISIARAILRNAPILLLDEATSALDAESEKLVQDALDKLMEGRTTLVIAHRLATIRSAQRIIVMDDGKIIEEGSHAELTKAKGMYARLASLQFNS